MDLSTAKGMLINIAAGEDLTFYEVEAAASRVEAEIPLDASIIVGQCNNPELSGRLRVSVVATGLGKNQRKRRRSQPVMTLQIKLWNSPRRQCQQRGDACTRLWC